MNAKNAFIFIYSNDVLHGYLLSRGDWRDFFYLAGGEAQKLDQILAVGARLRNEIDPVVFLRD